ncbi:flagellar export chaperone FliS [Patescibacteria group bacterium]|nr:flagellar export chaperone FliS [Patescibacteria group bacterium]
MKNGYEQYQVNQVETADPKQLIVMLYEGAIRFLEEALVHIDNFKKYDIVNNKILRAQDIITELMVSLDMEKGGEIADNLLSLYVYMKKELLEANVKKERASIERVLKMFRDLLDAWKQIDSRAGVVKKELTEAEKMAIRKAGFVARG